MTELNRSIRQVIGKIPHRRIAERMNISLSTFYRWMDNGVPEQEQMILKTIEEIEREEVENEIRMLDEEEMQQ